MITNATEYYKRIYNRINGKMPQGLVLDMDVYGLDNTRLRASMLNIPSDTGIIIIPGITVPRESCFKLLHAVSKYRTLVYDIRGQANSEEEVDYDKCVADINIIGNWFRNKYGLKYLIGIGHSFSGICLLGSSMDKKHPYDLRIALAAPFDMYRAAGRAPEHLTTAIIYLYNIMRWFTNKPHHDEIYRHHQSFWPIKFFKKPSMGALNLKGPSAINKVRVATPKLTDFISDVALPTSLIYASKDKRIGTNEYFQEQYELLSEDSKKKGFELCLMEGLTHRFNLENENQFIMSYDNNAVIEKINDILKAKTVFHQPGEKI